MKHGYCSEYGEVKLTREQYREYWALLYAYDMQQYCYRVEKARERDAALKERELAQIEEEEKELSKWYWYAAGIGGFTTIAAMVFAITTGNDGVDAVVKMLPFMPAIIAAIMWADQMEDIIIEEKDPWFELVKLVGIAIIAGILLYISFIFVLAILLLAKPAKMFGK